MYQRSFSKLSSIYILGMVLSRILIEGIYLLHYSWLPFCYVYTYTQNRYIANQDQYLYKTKMGFQNIQKIYFAEGKNQFHEKRYLSVYVFVFFCCLFFYFLFTNSHGTIQYKLKLIYTRAHIFKKFSIRNNYDPISWSPGDGTSPLPKLKLCG